MSFGQKNASSHHNNPEYMSGFDDNSMPCDELASQNMISEPCEIEDSQASDYLQIKHKNERKRRNQGKEPQDPHNLDEIGSQLYPKNMLSDSNTKLPGDGSLMGSKSRQNMPQNKGMSHEPEIKEFNPLVGAEGFDSQVTEKDDLMMSLEQHQNSQHRPRQ